MSDNSIAAVRKRHAEAALDIVDDAITRIENAYQVKGIPMDERVMLALRVVQYGVTEAREMVQDVYDNASAEERADDR